MTEFKAALFDFDGVVIHSTPVHLAGWAHAYQSMFHETLNLELLQSLMGRSTEAIGSLLAQKSGYMAAKKTLIKIKAQYVLDHLDTIELIGGIREFMEGLRAQGVPYGVVSNAPRDFIEAALAKHGLPCDFFLGLEDYYRPKPDPEPYIKGGKALGMVYQNNKSVVVFEDSTHGIEAAIGANMSAIGICSQHPSATLKDAGAQQCFVDFSATAGILGLFAKQKL